MRQHFPSYKLLIINKTLDESYLLTIKEPKL